MRISQLLVAALLALVPTTAQAQSGEAYRTIELRVTSVGSARKVLIDRGSNDQLLVGDIVRFFPRAGGAYAGLVREVLERSSVVEVHDPDFLPEPGTRGEARVPRERFGEVVVPPVPVEPVVPGSDPGTAPEGVPGETAEDDTEHPPWEREDDWVEGQPLLAQVEVLRPEQREPTFSGRVYVTADAMAATQDDRSDGFYRLGTDLRYGNMFGRGGDLHIDAEWNYRNTDLPGSDESEGDLRVDRLSYAWGGTRYAPVRHEVGRFLHKGMPEFGVVDGYEWSGRGSDGVRMGYSLGFMPEPDKDMDSGRDFEFSAFYRWIADENERTATSVGFQKTFHSGNADRDLLIAKFHVLPEQGWQWLGTAWVDYYTSGEDVKDSGVDLTQAFLSASKDWASGTRLDLTYTHLAIPDIERFEFLKPDPTTLEEARNDRIAVDASTPWRDRRLQGGLGAWSDQEDVGGDGRLGLEFNDWVLDGSRTNLSAFGTYGRFSSLYGARIDYGWLAANGSWDVLFEIALNDQFGFDQDNDNLLQQRYRVMRQFRTQGGWDFAAHVEGTILEDEEGLGLGFYLQRSF